MSNVSLNLANIFYGASRYPVDADRLPATFDFANAEECAKLIFAVMSNASGGHTIKDCKVRYSEEHGYANLTGHGIHVYYKDAERPKYDSVEAAIAAHESATVLELGSVTTDQYGDGWKRAKWRK